MIIGFMLGWGKLRPFLMRNRIAAGLAQDRGVSSPAPLLGVAVSLLPIARFISSVALLIPSIAANDDVEVARFTQLHPKHASHRYCNLSRFHPSQPQAISHPPPHDAPNHYIGHNVSRKDKNKYLLSTLLDLNDTKEAVYGSLDAWVAWEQNFPIASLKLILNALEKQQQWHRVVQVIKWMLSKGQGNTMGTYGQLIRALDMDHRVEEAHKFWQTKIGTDLHSVPWQLCHLMISVYYRNNMLDDLVRLFKGLEAFDRKPRDKSIIQKVANAYEMLGLHQEKERVLEKYSNLFTEEGSIKKARRNLERQTLTEKGKQKESTKATSEKI